MKPSNKGERIRSARLIAGLTQKELANNANLSQALISQVESGLRLATDETVIAVAQAVGMPQSFFDVQVENIPDGTMRFRKLASSRITETRRVEELAREAWRVWSSMMRDVQYPKPSLPTRPANGELDFEEVARAARQALGLGVDRPIGHLTRTLESHGIAVIRMGGADDPEQLGHFGVSCWPSPLDYGIIAVFPGPGDRERFTLAHELGHFILHRHVDDLDGAELEANRFAGALLLPASRMEEAIGDGITLSDLARLKARWGVSMQAIIMRGGELGLIDPARKSSLFRQLSARGWRTAEPVEVHNEQPVLTWELLRRSFGPRPYRSAGEALGMNEMLLRGWASPTSAS